MGLLDRIRRRWGRVQTQPVVSATTVPTRPRVQVPLAPPPPAASSPRGETDPHAWITDIVRTHPVVLFMKGSPEDPMCGFSASAAGILGGYGVPLHHVDVLLDPEVREAVKTFSSWPTLPQVYVSGEFLGGADILRDMHESGELRSRFEALAASSA